MYLLEYNHSSITNIVVNIGHVHYENEIVDLCYTHSFTKNALLVPLLFTYSKLVLTKKNAYLFLAKASTLYIIEKEPVIIEDGQHQTNFVRQRFV